MHDRLACMSRDEPASTGMGSPSMPPVLEPQLDNDQMLLFGAGATFQSNRSAGMLPRMQLAEGQQASTSSETVAQHSMHQPLVTATQTRQHEPALQHTAETRSARCVPVPHSMQCCALLDSVARTCQHSRAAAPRLRRQRRLVAHAPCVSKSLSS